MKLYVTVSDFAAAYHMGASVETTTKDFPMPKEVEDFIRSVGNSNNCITLSFDKETP